MWRMGMMGMMAMHRMMKMNITPVVVSCAAWPGEAEASESTRLTLKIAGSPSRAEHDCMRLSNGVAWRARSGWGVEGGIVPNEPPYNPRGRLSNGVAWRARSGWGVEGGIVPNEPPYNTRGPDSDGDAQALPPGSTGRHAQENLWPAFLCEVMCAGLIISHRKPVLINFPQKRVSNGRRATGANLAYAVSASPEGDGMV